MYVSAPASSRFSIAVADFISAHLTFAAYATNSAHGTPPKLRLINYTIKFLLWQLFCLIFLKLLAFFSKL